MKAALFEEALVVVHLQLAFHLGHGIEGNADHDEDGRAAERLDKLVVREVEQDGGHDRDERNEQPAGQRDATQYVADVGDRSRTRTDTRDEAALLAQIVRRLLRIEHHGGVEVREEHDEQQRENPVEPPRGQRIGGRRKPTDVEQRRQLSREVDQATGEDDGDDAGRIDLERDIRRLPAEHLAPLNALGIVHRDATLCALDEDDERNAHDHHGYDERRDGQAHACGISQVHRRENSRGNARHDAHEDDERHAVADTPLRDKLAHPHDERRARHEREHHDDARKPAGNGVAENHAIGRRLEQQQIADRIDQTETERKVTRDLRDFAATCFAVLGPAADCGDDALHELHDDRRRDVGHDAEREHREMRKRASGEQVEHRHRHTAALGRHERLRELAERDSRHRQVGAEAVQRQNGKREEDLLAKLRYLECVD